MLCWCRSDERRHGGDICGREGEYAGAGVGEEREREEEEQRGGERAEAEHQRLQAAPALLESDQSVSAEGREWTRTYYCTSAGSSRCQSL